MEAFNSSTSPVDRHKEKLHYEPAGAKHGASSRKQALPEIRQTHRVNISTRPRLKLASQLLLQRWVNIIVHFLSALCVIFSASFRDEGINALGGKQTLRGLEETTMFLV